MTNREFRKALAILWRDISRLNERDIFKDAPTARRHARGDDALAQPGYVGRGYRPGGVVFIGANPGGAKLKNVVTDGQQNRFLRALKRAGSEAESIDAFEALTAHLATAMRGWRLPQVAVNPVIAGTKIGFEDIAFINIVKWRTNAEKVPTSALHASWDFGTAQQVKLLRPSIIVALGTTVAGRYLVKVATGAKRLFVIKRMRGDRSLPPEGLREARRAQRFLACTF